MPLTYAQIKARKESDPEYAARLKSYADKYAEKNHEKEKERHRLAKAKLREIDRESRNAYMREWTAKNKESVNAKRREARKSNPEKAALDNARRKSKHDPLHHRSIMLKNNYGIGLDDYLKMYDFQGGKCAICDELKPNSGRGGLVVDHCHKEGHVRKLLCSHCNTGLGQFKDDVHLLAKAIDYLSQY